MNIVYFTTIIFENYVDLITENSKIKAEQFVTTVVSSLKKFSSEVKRSKMFRTRNSKEIASEVENTISHLVKDYIIFSDSGKILIKLKTDIKY